jgi:hypothetical protein
VARDHQLDARAPQRFDHVEIFLSGNPEDAIDVLILERRHQQI